VAPSVLVAGLGAVGGSAGRRRTVRRAPEELLGVGREHQLDAQLVERDLARAAEAATIETVGTT
jgi:hypothetical protein